MKNLKDLTPEIKAKIPIYIEKAIAGVFDGERYNNFSFDKAKKAVDYNYQYCGELKPILIVAENPYEAQLLFNYIASNTDLHSLISLIWNNLNDSQLTSQLDSQLRSQLTSQLTSQLDSQLNSQLRSQLYSQLNSQLRSQLYSQLYSQLTSQLTSQLRSQLYSQLDSQLDSQLRSQLHRYNDDYLFTLNVYSDSYFTWYDFIKTEFNINSIDFSKFKNKNH